MTQRDYILRMAEMLGRALADILYSREIRDYAAAHELIEEQFRQILGVGAGFIHSVPEDTLLSMLTSFDTLDIEKCLMLAILLKAEGDIYEDQANPDASYYSYLKSLNLFLEVLLYEDNFKSAGNFPEIEDLLNKLEAYELPVRTEQLLFRYFEEIGKYSRAEDVLFDMLDTGEADDELIERGFAFYRRLMRKSDAELLAGNLAREEVEEGLGRLEGMKF